jgi:ATP-dependent RNA helicase DHX8/PRP22
MSASTSALERLALVSRICTELDNHLGLSDKTLAEFIIHLADRHTTAAAFTEALNQNGAQFPASFAENLLRIIQAMKPQQAAASKKRGAAQSGKTCADSVALHLAGVTTSPSLPSPARHSSTAT